ncbi:SLATT domain-containing protein [Nocardia arthritidis]|uniref:SLATT domain-containing protein n=1 Tax=Nocardia arthritidis TaxID=228602 RepID=UPI0007A5372D|nr:SLATT domain-containing protein [Nocardia arthritidis]
MAGAEQAEFLAAELAAQKALFERRRSRDKRKAFTLRMATVCFSAAITILLGLQVSLDVRPILSDIALTLGALTTVLAAYEAFYDHRGLWIGRTVTVDRIAELERNLEFRLLGRDSDRSEVVVDDLLQGLNTIISDDRQGWLKLRASRESSSEPDGNGPHRANTR